MTHPLVVCLRCMLAQTVAACERRSKSASEWRRRGSAVLAEASRASVCGRPVGVLFVVFVLGMFLCSAGAPVPPSRPALRRPERAEPVKSAQRSGPAVTSNPGLILIDVAGTYERALTVAVDRARLTLIPAAPISMRCCKQKLTVRIPGYLVDAMKQKALDHRTTVRHLVLLALQKDGYTVDQTDLLPGARGSD
jgi:hypothetical protein